jgi:two-component system response regulator (stage 0 sporulation protein F)
MIQRMNGKKILIVDDEAPFRIFLRKLLERLGASVETSASGLVSLEIANREPPDVLIIDWMLKDSLDGLQIAAELRLRNPNLATVLITGYPSPALERRVQQEPRTIHLFKPFESDDILSAIQAVLE